MIHVIAMLCLAIFMLSYGISGATNVEIVWLDVAGALAALFGGVLFLIELATGANRT